MMVSVVDYIDNTITNANEEANDVRYRGQEVAYAVLAECHDDIEAECEEIEVTLSELEKIEGANDLEARDLTALIADITASVAAIKDMLVYE